MINLGKRGLRLKKTINKLDKLCDEVYFARLDRDFKTIYHIISETEKHENFSKNTQERFASETYAEFLEQRIKDIYNIINQHILSNYYDARTKDMYLSGTDAWVHEFFAD